MKMSIRVLPWETFARTGNSTFVRLTILVPILGYLIIFNNYLVSLFEISPIYVPSLADDSAGFLDSKYRLYYFYFGLFFVGIGSITYQLFCPSLIKEFRSIFHYLEKGRKAYSRYGLNELYNSMLKSKSEEAKRTLHTISDEARERGVVDDNPDDYEGWENHLESYDIELKRAYWTHLNHSNVLFRVITQICFFLGFLFLAVPSLEMFFQVLKAALHY
ncbi:hypothetical protein ACFL00_00310 [Pseudomonadota bacterium]